MIIEKRKVKIYSLKLEEYNLFRKDIIELNENAIEFKEWHNPVNNMYMMEFLYEKEKA